MAVTLQGKGIDISYPQEPDFSLDSKSHKVIAKNMPSHPDFVVVGVNDGHPYSQNPAFDLEAAWAHQVAGDDVSFYVNLANTSSNPVQAEADGKQIAYYDLKLIKTDPALPTPTTVMLDVETANSWQGLHLDTTNKADTAKIIAAQASNRAAAEGAVEEFHEHGIRVVLYSAKNMWARIMGSVSPDSVLKVPEWHAPGGAAALRDNPFIAGNRVVMGQTVAPYPAHSKHYLDIDFARPKG